MYIKVYGLQECCIRTVTDRRLSQKRTRARLLIATVLPSRQVTKKEKQTMRVQVCLLNSAAPTLSHGTPCITPMPPAEAHNTSIEVVTVGDRIKMIVIQFSADMEDEDDVDGGKSSQRKKVAKRRHYQPRKARDFKSMDNFEVPTQQQTSLYMCN